MAEKCKECGCKCGHCTKNEQQQGDMHLHVEIENLRQRLLERDNHIVTMETQFLNEADKFPNGELASMKEELLISEEKYTRLHEAHKRVQKVNQNLEDKLLKIVDKCETEKSAFTKDIATLSHRLADANYTIHRLTQDNEKYRNDINLAIQLLQCKPSNFVGQKYDSLPSEVQAKVRTYVAQKRRSSDVNPPDVKSITVPISTFPPTAMVYNVTKSNVEKHSDDDSDEPKPPIDVSAAIMAKVLEDREKERIFAKHCDTCTCHRSIVMVDAITQTAVEDIVSCNDCRMKYLQTNENNPDSRKSNEKNTQGKENQNSMTQTIYQEVNENAGNYGKVQLHNNTHCTKNTSCQHLSARDKFVTRNGRVFENSKEDGRVNVNVKSSLNKKNSMRRNDPQLQCVFQSQNESINKQSSSQKVGDPSRVNSDKAKQTGFNKRCDSQIDTKSNTNLWNNLDKKSSSDRTGVENSQSNNGGLEPSHIDIINDRLWKNEWTKLKSQVNPKDARNVDKISSDVEIDIINDRTWRNDRSVQQTRQPTQLTVIEVKSIDNIANQNDSGQVEVATSPSFSSDSMVISTSDPSSSSSDVVQSTTGTQLSHNVSNTKPSSQSRITGPRNCLVRVTPGSKNILLDNVGHYKTVLYTSGNSKPNTALVHTKKSSRSGSERSISTSSEENSPVLLHDNNQLQRVAEWVQSSVHMESTVTSGCKLKSNEKIMDETSALVYVNDSRSTNKSLDNDKRLLGNIPENNCSVIDMEDYNGKGLRNEMNSVSLSSHISHANEEKDKDLITFDVPNEDQKLPKNNKEATEFDCEFKITKEMEETYLKLAASLDPVTLSLSGTDSADLTIEKYRKDYKKLCVQKGHDKAGSKT